MMMMRYIHINMKGQRLEKIISFKYLGVTLRNDGIYSADIHISVASANTVPMAKSKRIWRKGPRNCTQQLMTDDDYITKRCGRNKMSKQEREANSKPSPTIR